MNQLNSILIEGNLVRDPEFTTTSKGTSICKFTIASNRYFKQGNEFQQEVSYFDVVTWSDLAARCSEKLKKGKGVRVIGRLKQERWTDKDGHGKSKVCIVANHVEWRVQHDEKVT